MAEALTAHALAGETLDALVWREIGRAAIEPVLEANPGLAELGVILPEGHPVLLPAIEASASAAPALIQLWD